MICIYCHSNRTLCVCLCVRLCVSLSTFFKCKPRKVFHAFLEFFFWLLFPRFGSLRFRPRWNRNWVEFSKAAAFYALFLAVSLNIEHTLELSLQSFRGRLQSCSVRFQQLLATIATVAASVFTGVCFGPNTFYCLPKFLWGFFAFPGTQFIFYIFPFFRFWFRVANRNTLAVVALWLWRRVAGKRLPLVAWQFNAELGNREKSEKKLAACSQVWFWIHSTHL